MQLAHRHGEAEPAQHGRSLDRFEARTIGPSG
jgi:hypothetical protein